jgi:hypothetical protein
MTEINVEMLKERLYKVAHALFCISETCVEVSKQHISEEAALNKIRSYLNDAGMWSKLKVDKLIGECMEPQIYNWFEDYGKKYLEVNGLDYPSCCDGCSNNPKNGGSGICNCTLPYMQNPINYTAPSGDACMANNTNGYIYFVDDINNLNTYKADANRIAEATANISKYIKE